MSFKAGIAHYRPRPGVGPIGNFRAFWSLFVVVYCAAYSISATAQEAAYVVMGREGAVARTVFTGDVACPPITLDGMQQATEVRAKPSERFPVTVCEKLIPPGTKSVSIAGKPLPVPKDRLASVVVLGDTGCRMKAAAGASEDSDDETEGKFQSCNDRSKWPFAQVSAAAAAALPDLVIHVGDYLYRESQCPLTDGGCKNSPWGDDWDAWKADFFQPAQRLLAAAPWIMTRGNHEICSRAGRGYFLLLDPALATGKPLSCADNLEPYPVTMAGRQFIVIDSSSAPDGPPDKSPTKEEIDRYRKQFEKLEAAPSAWLISHRPIWAVKSHHRLLNETLNEALPTRSGVHMLPEQVELVLSGHIHLWEAIGFKDGFSPQFVIGDGGTALAKDINKADKNKFPEKQIWGREVDRKRSRSEHLWGFTQFILISTATGGWKATLFDPTGAKRAKCSVAQGRVDCS